MSSTQSLPLFIWLSLKPFLISCSLTTLCLAQDTPRPAIDADIVLQGGTLFIGDGQPGIRGDLAIKDGRIVGGGKVAVGKECPRLPSGHEGMKSCSVSCSVHKGIAAIPLPNEKVTKKTFVARNEKWWQN